MSRASGRGRAALALGLLALSACRGGSGPAEPAATLAVAYSLKRSMPALIEAFHAQRGGPRTLATYGGSGDLRRQVAGGAPIDAVVLADAGNVDQLIAGGHADPATRRVIASNALVLIGPAGGPAVTFATLEHLPAGARVAVGDPASVPAGAYARQALTALGTWDAIRDRLVFGGHVGAVLTYARRGEVAAAVVYKTDVRGIADLVVLEEAQGSWAPRTEVVAALVRHGPAPAPARAFLDFLTSGDARRILADDGFGAP